MVKGYYFDELSVVDLGRRSGKSSEAVYKLLQRLRRTLFDCVNKQAELAKGGGSVNPHVERVLILAEAVCAGDGTKAEVAELRDLLHNDPEALDAYLRLTDLHITLATSTELAAQGGLMTADFTTVRPRWQRWLAYAMACAALLLIGAFLSRPKTQQSQPDLTAAITSTENAIARMPAPSFSPLPSWMSPTASMLDQPGFPP